MDFKAVIALALLAGAYAGPVNLGARLLGQTACARQCTAKSKFSYTVGDTYVFSYEAETKTGLYGAAEDQTGLRITTTAEVEVLSKCELALTLSGSQVYGSDPKYPKTFLKDKQNSEFQKDLERYILRFSFQDGIIEELCPTVEESTWALNIKRGILSAFQNGMDSFSNEQNLVETDVTGKCRTEYKLIQEGRKLLKIKKIKDLNTCFDRHGYDSSISSSLYSVPSSIQSLPLLQSTHECNQEISNIDGHVKSVDCHEMHVFRPFSKGNSGATTEATQKLTFVSKSTKSSVRMAEVTRRETLLFDHTGGEKGSKTSDTAFDKLKELCIATKDSIQAETPKMFSELVMILKKQDSDSLDKIYKKIKKSNFCPENSERVEKFYLDAIPMVGTGAAVRQITQYIMNNDVSGITAEAWLSSLAFIQHPTKDILSEISKMLNTIHGSRVALPLSSLVNTYCSVNSKCEEDSEVSTIISTLGSNIDGGCSNTDHTKILLSLRAIGNTGYAQALIPMLDQCISQSKNPMQIRVAAVEAYRRMSCGADRNNLMIVFRNSDEDSELRIAAYLQVMKCPNDFFIEQIKETLKTEEVNQVGSFVWTHIENLKETSSVHKQAIKEILHDQDLPKKFDMDVRKFSRNYDWSYFSKEMNAGGSVESNLIWSPESFIPRSAMANLTIDMFGHSVNLLEIGGRAEGLDYLLESYFGPSGYGSNKILAPEEKENKQIKMKKFNKIDSAFDKKVQELKAAMYMRVFGNEIIYHQFDDADKKDKSKEFNLLEFFMELSKDHRKNLMRSNVFLDSTIVVPTMVGLPLNLTVNGVSTVDIKTSGKMDLKKPAKAILIEGSLKPSGAVEVASVMSVDAFYTKSGLKMTSVLHSSTAIKGKIEIKEKEDFTFEFDIPQEKSEIVNVKSSFFMVYKEEEKEQQMLNKKESQRKFCSGNTLARFTGMELCGEISYPTTQRSDAPHFPLTGPVNIVLNLYKRDTHTGYRFEIKKINNRKKINYMIHYDTPGSKVNRATGALFEVDKLKKRMEISMTSPWRKAKFTGDVVDTNKMKSVTGIASVDDIYEYRVNAELGRNEKGSIIKYNPKVEVSYPEGDPVLLTGRMEYIKTKSLEADLVMTGATATPMYLQTTLKYNDKLKGLSFNFTHEKKEYHSEAMVRISKKNNRLTLQPKLIVKTPKTEYANLKGTIDHKVGKSVKIDLTLTKVYRDPLALKASFTKAPKKKRTIYKGTLNLKGPKFNMRGQLSVDKRAKVLSGNVKGYYNLARYIKWAKDSFQFNSKIVNKSTKKLKKVDVKADFKSAKFAEYNNKLVMNVYSRPNKVAELETTFDYGKSFMAKNNKQRVTFKASTSYNIAKYSAKIGYNVTLKYLEKKVDAALFGNHFHTKKNIKSSATIRYNGKQSITTLVKFLDESAKLPKYSGSLSVSYPGRHIEINAKAVQKSATQYNTKWTIEHQKGQSSVVSVKYIRADNITHEVESNIGLYKMKPISLSASTILSMQTPSGSVSVVHGKDRYGLMASGTYEDGKSIQFSTSVDHPDRKVIIEGEGGKKDLRYNGKFNVLWDAEKDKDKQVGVEVSSRFADAREFDMFFSSQFPGRLVSANIRHISKSPYKSSIELSWSPSDKIGANYEFVDNRRVYRGVTKFSAGLRLPIKRFEEHQLSLGYKYTRNSYEVNSAITYGKRKTVSVKLATKRPVMFSDADLSVEITTPYKRLRNPKFSFRQTFDSSFLVHSATTGLSWGDNMFISIETNGQSKPYQRYHRQISRNIGLRSSFPGYESVVANITHFDNLEKFETKSTINRNNEISSYLFKMTHNIDGWKIQNSGTFDIKSKYDTMALVWSHRNTDNQVRSSSSIKWGKGQRFNTELTADIQNMPYRRFTANFNMDVPSNTLRRVEARFEHEDKTGYIKTIGTITADRRNIGTAQLNYDRQIGSTDFDASITSIYMKEIRVAGNTKYLTMPNSGFVEVEWAPTQIVRLDVYRNMDALRNTENRLTLTTPFPRARNIELSLSHKLKGLEYVAQGDLEFAPRQKVTLTVNYRLDTEKKVRLSLRTPFPQFSNLETGAYFKGSEVQFDSNADFKIVPLVPKINAEAKWEMLRNMKGSFQLVTPYPQFPRLMAEVTSAPSPAGRTSKLMLEYVPTQKIELESLYTVNGNQLDGSFIIKSPWSRPATIAYTQTGDANDFVNHAEVKYNNNQKLVIDTTFGLQPMVYGTVKVISPIKGFEVAELGFSHEGKEWKKFRTLAEYGTDGNKIQVETMLDVISGINGKVMLTTPFKNLSKVQIAFDHGGNAQNFKTHAEAIYNKKAVTTDVSFSHVMALTSGSLTLTTPAKEFKLLNIAFNHDGQIDNFKTHGETTFNDRKYESDVVFSHTDALTSGTLSMKSPVEEWKETVLTFSRDGSADNFKASAKIGYQDKEIKGTLQHQLSAADVSTIATLETPYTEKIMFRLDHNSRKKGFTTDVEATMGNDNSIKSKTVYKLKGDSLQFNSEQVTVTGGEKQSDGFDVNHKGDLSGFRTEVNTWHNKQKLSASAAFSGSSWETTQVAVVINTPHTVFDNMEFTLKNSKTGMEHASIAEVTYTTGKTITAKSTITLELPKIDATLTVSTPFAGAEKLAFGVKNTPNGNAYNSDVSVVIDGSQLYSVVSNIDTDTYTGDISIFRKSEKLFDLSYIEEDGGRKMDANVRYEEYVISTRSKCIVNLPNINCEVRLPVGFIIDCDCDYMDITIDNTVQGALYTTSAEATLSDKRVSAKSIINVPLPDVFIDLQLDTPVEGYRKSKLEMSKTGGWGDGVSKIYISSDKITPIVGEANLAYKGPSKLEYSMKFRSGFKGAEYLQLYLKNVFTNKEGENKMNLENHLDLDLDPERKISHDLTYKQEHNEAGDYETSYKWILTTPFEQVKNLQIASAASKLGKKMADTYVMDYNGKTLYDVERQIYIDSDAHKYDLVVICREPKKMEYSLSMQKNGQTYTGDLNLNWDKLDVDSNTQITGTVTVANTDNVLNNDINIRAVHPLRTVALIGNLLHDDDNTNSKLTVTWDEANKQMAGFETNLRGKQNFVKIIVPQRSLAAKQEVNDDKPVKWCETSVFWDYDNDKSKSVVVKGITNTQAQYDEKVLLKLPVFGKTYSWHSIVTTAAGRVDTQTVISYSPDTRKDFIITSKLEEVNTIGGANQSVSFGVKQAFTNLDMTLYGHKSDSTDKTTAGFGIDYLTAKKQRKNVLLLSEINKLKNEMSVNMYGSGKSLGFIGRVQTSNPYKFVLTNVIDGTQSDAVVVNVDARKKSVELQAKYDREHPNSVLNMVAKYPTSKDIEAQMYRVGDFPQVTESLVSIQLKSSNLLHTRINWRPDMFAEFLDYTVKTMKKYGSEANDIFKEVGTEIASEVASKDSAMSKELINEIKPYADALANQIENTQSELNTLRRKLKEMHRNNDLYLQDINKMYDNAVQDFIKSYAKTMKSFKKNFADMRQKAEEMSNSIQDYPFDEKYTELVQTAAKNMEDYGEKAYQWMRAQVTLLIKEMEKNIQELQKQTKQLAAQAKKLAQEKIDFVIQHPNVVQMKQQVGEMMNKVPVMPDIDLLMEQMQNGVNKMGLRKQYKKIVNSVKKVYNDQYNTLMQDKDFTMFKELIREFYEELLLRVQYIELRDSLKELVGDMYTDYKTYITDDVAKLKFIGWDKSRVIEFDPVNGKIEVELYIPTPMESLETLPKFPVKKAKKFVSQVKKSVQGLIPNTEFRPWDLYYKYKPASMNPHDWIPPFKGYAFVAGNRHFVTFDGTQFDFVGDCSFLLTRDLVNNNFSVVLNYEKGQEKIKSLLVFAEGKNIEIFGDYSVSVDDQQHDLPFVFHKLIVERKGNLIILDSGRGLKITSDVLNGHHVIEVSGWYFGKLAGLLGTYNNEQYDELTDSTAHIVNNLGDFSNTWEVSKSCKPVGNKAVEIIPDETEAKYKKCSTMFKNNDSRFRRCFSQVKPEMAFSMCLNQGRICAAASAYIKQCDMAGVYLSLPEECVQCTAPNDEVFVGGESIKISPSSDDYQVLASSDNVIIIEELPCNKQPSKNLGYLINKMEEKLTKSGLTNNRYGLVGIGRKEARSYTMENEFLNDAIHFSKGVEAMTFTSYKTNTLEAIMHSINYPFRSGVAKNIILLQCGSCSTDKSNLYSGVRGMLNTRDIKLHILRGQEFMVGNRSPKAKILGVDNDRKYVLRNSKATSRENLTIPVDTCSHLALISGGSIFDSSGLTLKKMRDRNYFMNIFSNRLSQTSAAHECQVCECVSDETGAARSVCRKCNTKITDYLPDWWSGIKHPGLLHEKLERNFQKYMDSDETWNVFKA